MSSSHDLTKHDSAKAPLLPSRLSLTAGSEATVDEVLSFIGTGRFQFFILLILGCTYTADAAEVLLLSFLGPDMKCEWGLNGTQVSLVTALAFVGMGTGSLLFGALADVFGRKPVAILIVADVSIAGVLTAFAPSYEWLVLARVIVGVGLGGLMLILGMFSEYLPVEKRGRQLIGYQFFWSIGACFAALLAWMVMPHYHWRGLVLFSAIPMILLLVVLPAVPESPRYLVVKGKEHKALEVLNLIARINGKSLPTGLKLKAGSSADVTAASDAPHQNKVAFIDRFWTLLAYPLNHITPYIWTLWPMLALGYYGIVILTTSIQADSKEDDETCVDSHISLSQNDYLSIFIDSTAEVSSTLMCLLVIEHIGRKRLIMVCSLGAALCVSLLPVSTAFHTALLFAARFCCNMQFITMLVMAAEIYPSSCRSLAIGVGNFISRLGGIASPFLAQDLLDAYGILPTALLHGLLFLCATFIAWKIPIETKGRPMKDNLEEMAEEFDSIKQQERTQQEALEP